MTLLYSLVIALVMPAVEEAVEEAEVEVENATNVEKSGISLVHALILLVMVEGTVHLVVAMVRRRPGRCYLCRPVFWLIICLIVIHVVA